MNLPCPVLVYTESFGTDFVDYYVESRPEIRAHYLSIGCYCGWIVR